LRIPYLKTTFHYSGFTGQLSLHLEWKQTQCRFSCKRVCQLFPRFTICRWMDISRLEYGAIWNQNCMV